MSSISTKMRQISVKPKIKKKRSSGESQHQIAFFNWIKMQSVKYPELNFVFHIPNGKQRHVIVATQLKREGVRKGVPDLMLLVPKGNFHGFVAELKFGHGRTSDEQEIWFNFLRKQGYFVGVYWEWTHLAADIVKYLDS